MSHQRSIESSLVPISRNRNNNQNNHRNSNLNNIQNNQIIIIQNNNRNRSTSSANKHSNKNHPASKYDWERNGHGYNRNEKKWKAIRNEIKVVNAETLKRHFACAWRIKYSWLHLRGTIRVLNQDQFKPAFICKPCNIYYSNNPTVCSDISNKYKNAVLILNADTRVQHSSLAKHDNARAHRIALGLAAT